MGRALVLNVTDEPLAVVSDRRAVVLVLGEKVDVVTAGLGTFRSERSSCVVPSVVRLRRYVHPPRARRAALNRRGVFARDDHRCQYCPAPAESLDHVVPRSRGGAHSWDNVVAACRACNVAKRDRLLVETTMRLRRPPGPPPPHTWLAATVRDLPDAWRPYLGNGSPHRGSEPRGRVPGDDLHVA